MLPFAGGGVGKSALTVQFVKNYFVSTYDPTIEDTFRKTIPIDGQDCLVEILDTAGADTFVALKELYMKSGQGFILVFSLTHLGSVNELGPLREQIMRIKGSKVSRMMGTEELQYSFDQANMVTDLNSRLNDLFSPLSRSPSSS